jgi:hypothetical protein
MPPPMFKMSDVIEEEELAAAATAPPSLGMGS